MFFKKKELIFNTSQKGVFLIIIKPLGIMNQKNERNFHQIVGEKASQIFSYKIS